MTYISFAEGHQIDSVFQNLYLGLMYQASDFQTENKIY